MGCSNMRLFAEKRLQDYIEERKRSISSLIESEKDDYILQVNEDDYVTHIVSKTNIEPLEIKVDDIYVSTCEQLIPAERFPRKIHVFQGKSYKTTVIKFHIPIAGNKELLSCMPSSRLGWTRDVEVLKNEITFEIIDYSSDEESIKKEMKSTVDNIVQQHQKVLEEVEQYNNSLVEIVRRTFIGRKQRIINKGEFLESLGVPIKKSSKVSETFSIPPPELRKKVTIVKPEILEKNFIPEPMLDDSTYNQILKLVHDVGKQFERLPSLYSGKEEEHLRDHILMLLEPNFVGSATGETFNSDGKTDILLRYEGNNVFIAECKFWTGKKGFLETITQLLGYLTWRDSKSAVIIFVKNKDISTVLETVKNVIVEHYNYLDFVGASDESWFNYLFHINGDRNRMVKLAVMLYHIPG